MAQESTTSGFAVPTQAYAGSARHCGPRGIDLHAGLHHRVVLVGDIDIGAIDPDSWRRVIVRVGEPQALRGLLAPCTLAAVCVTAPGIIALEEQRSILARSCPGALVHVLDTGALTIHNASPRDSVAAVLSAAYHRRLADTARLEMALRPFGLAQREAVLFALYWFGVPRKELARAMNIKESTVASLIRRALAKTDASSLANLAQRVRTAQSG
jgi:DNA-binding CsgD family transcriptional regulator